MLKLARFGLMAVAGLLSALVVVGALSSPAAAQGDGGGATESEGDGGGSFLSVPRPEPESATELDEAWSTFSDLGWRGVGFAFAIAGALATVAILLGHFGTHGGAAMAARSWVLGIAGAALFAGSFFPFVDFLSNVASTLF